MVKVKLIGIFNDELTNYEDKESFVIINCSESEYQMLKEKYQNSDTTRLELI